MAIAGVKIFSLLTLLSGCITASAQSASGSSPSPLQSFKSSPLQPPFLNVTKRGQTELGYLFVGPMDGDRQGASYPIIYSDDGQLVWQGPLMNISAFQPQVLNGEPVLAYWNGNNPHTGYGYGFISILDSSYHEIHKVTLPRHKGNFFTSYGPQDSYIDIHESHITDQGTILVTVVNTTRADLSPVGGPKDGWLLDGLFYEIDIKSNEILFRWSALEHLDEIPMTNAVVPLDGKGHSASNPFAYAHLNSVAKYGENYLISSRYMCSIFFINKHGHVIWHLHGQRGGDFTLGLGSSFCFQHDPRFLYHTPQKARMSLHNNANDDYSSLTSITTGLVLDLDLQKRTTSVVRKMWNANQTPVFSTSQGSYQSLANDHVLLYHGDVPLVEEYDEKGACVMSAWYGSATNGMEGYRGYRSPWVGKPTTKPSVVACESDSGEDAAAVYVSWNGASDVQAWKIYAGKNKGSLGVVKTVAKNGFETRMKVEGVSRACAVMAQAVGGVNDGTKSEVVSVGKGC